MRSLRVTVLFALCAVSTASVDAEPPVHNTPIMGYGAATCALFGQDFKRAPQEMELSYFAWAQGYMSGMNFQSLLLHQEAKDLSSMSAREQKWRLRTFCDAYPLKDYVDGVNFLYLMMKPISREK